MKLRLCLSFRVRIPTERMNGSIMRSHFAVTLGCRVIDRAANGRIIAGNQGRPIGCTTRTEILDLRNTFSGNCRIK